jgi:hypothetical protein
VNPHYKKRSVRPTKNEDETENTELEYGYFCSLVARFRREVHPLTMIDYKARGTLFESHSGREVPIGDRELRTYTLPGHEYAGILFIEKEGVWATLKDTGGIELARRFDLLIVSAEGYSTEAMRRLLAKGQQEYGYQVFAWHDADPAGYNICRTLGEPTERMPDHHLDVIDIGLRLEEGLKMGLQTETFTRKNALPKEIIPNLTKEELEYFTGEYDKETGKWRNCQRIEINAIKPRDRVAYLERKISEAMQRKAQPAQAGEAPQSDRPPLDAMLNTAEAMVTRYLQEKTRAALEQRIDLKKIEAAALATLPQYNLTAELERALATDPKTPWREIVKQTAAERLINDDDLSSKIDQAVNAAIKQALNHDWTHP